MNLLKRKLLAICKSKPFLSGPAGRRPQGDGIGCQDGGANDRDYVFPKRDNYSKFSTKLSGGMSEFHIEVLRLCEYISTYLDM